MKKIATIYEKDIYPEKQTVFEVEYVDRLTGKAIVFDEFDKVALVGNKENEFLLLPGGGINPDEDTKEGIVRECVEEIGCIVRPMYEVGCIDDYRPRDKKHCISYCYTALVMGSKGIPNHTEDEKKIGMYVKWVKLEEAITILKKQEIELRAGRVSFYNTGFNIVRDLLFLEETKKNFKYLHE